MNYSKNFAVWEKGVLVDTGRYKKPKELWYSSLGLEQYKDSETPSHALHILEVVGDD